MITGRSRPVGHVTDTWECFLSIATIQKSSRSLISRFQERLRQTWVTVREFLFRSIVAILLTQTYRTGLAITVDAEVIIHKIFSTAITQVYYIPSHTMTQQTGGILTIEPYAAYELCRACGARVVIPMHYGGHGLGNRRLRPVDEFAGLFDPALVRRYNTNRLTLGADTPEQLALLSPPPGAGRY